MKIQKNVVLAALAVGVHGGCVSASSDVDSTAAPDLQQLELEWRRSAGSPRQFTLGKWGKDSERRRHHRTRHRHHSVDEPSSDENVSDGGVPSLIPDAAPAAPGDGEVSPGPIETEDAGAAPSNGSDPRAADAGSVEPPPTPPVPPPPTLPPPLPSDIVAQSALPIYALEAGVRLSEQELWERIAASPATCFGEDHSLPAHHYAETRAQVELALRANQARRTFAFGFEMFERRFQATLDAYVAADATEEQLLLETEYARRWDYDYSLYRPLLEAARELHAPALGLNIRREVVRTIGRTGLASLSAEMQAEMPELVLDDPEHLAFIYGLFGVLPEHAAEYGLENVYAAQTTWDEAMAESASNWLSAAGPDARLLFFAGEVHCHESAIPRRITRRTQLPVLSVRVVFESDLQQSDDSEASLNLEAGYDLVVVLSDAVVNTDGSEQ